MTVFWICKTPTWSRYHKDIEYISEPSRDLTDRFKEVIVTYEDPSKHPDYVPCKHVELSKGHMLFILGSRVEIIIKPVKETRILYFISCDDVGSL